MEWNAFDLISPAIKKTKTRLFPFDFKEWFKLVIISFLAGNRLGSFNGLPGGSPLQYVSQRTPKDVKASEAISQKANESISFSEPVRGAIRQYWWIGGIIVICLAILITILTYITSVFRFIFIEALINKESKFTFRKNHAKGVSLFLFKFVITLMSVAVVAALAYPYVYHFMKAKPILSSLGFSYILFSIVAFFVYLFLLGILLLFLKDFAIPYMYAKEVPTVFALKQSWKEILNNKVEVLVYWVARVLLGLGIGIISAFIALILSLAAFLVGGIIFLIGFLLYKVIGGQAVFMILGAIIGFALILSSVITHSMLVLSFRVFYRYFQLFNFEKLTKIKILKEF